MLLAGAKVEGARMEAVRMGVSRAVSRVGGGLADGRVSLLG